jgi:molybdopterin-guanine dinucleotide biosynthesis protein A
MGRSFPGICAAVLAGGRARRYGGMPKGLLPVGDGQTILDRELAALRASGIEDLRIVAEDALPYARWNVRVIPDLRPGMGPLGGVEAALADAADGSRAVLFLPCDLPGIGAGQIRALLQAFKAGGSLVAVAVTGDSLWHPLCSVVHNAARPAVTEALDAGRLKVRDVWESLGAVPVRFADPTPFFNVNAPADLARWRSLVERGDAQPR